MRRQTSRVVLGVFLLASLGLLVIAAEKPEAPKLRAVERIIDGDTIILDGGEKVRLIGIDTAEMDDPRPAVLGYARAGKAYLDGILHGRKVRLEHDWQKKDKYGRTLAYVYLPDGTFVNKKIVEAAPEPARRLFCRAPHPFRRAT